MPRWKNHGTTSDSVMRSVYIITFIFKLLGKNIYPIRAILDVIEYRYWLSSSFSTTRILANKTKMLKFILDEMNNRSNKKRVIEFGVAFGETSRYLVENLKSSFEYHGFDTFTGLPKKWRALPKGAISAGGLIPNISAKNVTFHKGLVEQTLNSSTLRKIFGLRTNNKNFTNLIIFDFDLYGPTLHALERIKPFLNNGDIIYFDEAFDRDERLIIENYVLDLIDVRILKASIFGLAFEVTQY